jgi:hypothetical protein
MAQVLAIGLGGCSILGSDVSAAEACAVPGREYAGPVVGAFNTTIGAISALLPSGGQPQALQGQPAGHAAILCYVDAEIPKAPPPGPNGEIRGPYNRIVLVIVDGVATLIQAGYRDQLPISAP